VCQKHLLLCFISGRWNHRLDGLINDERVEAVVRQLDQEYLRESAALTEDTGRVVFILKSREFDRFAQDFVMRHPDEVIVQFGCDLDTRLERVDNGQVEWYDLDLPEIIELRRKIIGTEGRVIIC
jgi:O-methyltransferase involved in polyketide biosynthesis